MFSSRKNLDTWENSFYEIATVSFFSLEPVGLWLQLAFEIGGNNVLFDFLSGNILFAAVVRKWNQKMILMIKNVIKQSYQSIKAVTNYRRTVTKTHSGLFTISQ